MKPVPWNVVALWAPLLLSCDQGHSRAVIGVVAASQAVGVAQALIAETAREGEPVVVLQQNSRPEESIEASFRRAEWALALPDLVAVVGHESSASALAAAPLYQEAGIPMVVATATSPLLKAVPGVYPLAADDSIQGAFLATFAVRQLGAQRPLVFFVDDEYGYGLRDGVVQEFDRMGIPVEGEVPISPTSNLAPILQASFARGVPDVVIAAARFPEVWTLARIAQDLAPGIRVLAGDGAYPAEGGLRIAGPAADSVYLSVYWHPLAADSAGQIFIERFHRLTDRQPTPADAMVFDAIMLTATAIRTVGANPEAVDRYLAELGLMSPTFQGVTSVISFRPGRVRPLLMIQPRNGKFRLVTTR